MKNKLKDLIDSKSIVKLTVPLLSLVLISGCASSTEDDRTKNAKDYTPTAIIGNERYNPPDKDPKGIPLYIKKF